MAHFEYSSIIEAPREKVFEFSSDIGNLGEILAANYKIELTSPATKLKKGVEYEIRITRVGVSVLWGIVIEEVIPNEMVRDRQSHGPFSMFIHTQKFEDHGQGTLLTDIIEYDVPFGLLGKLADDLFVRRDLQNIFRNRHQRITDHFATTSRS